MIGLMKRGPTLLDCIFLICANVGKIQYFDGVRDAVAVVDRPFLLLIADLHLFGADLQQAQSLLIGKIFVILQHDFSGEGEQSGVLDDFQLGLQFVAALHEPVLEFLPLLPLTVDGVV